MLDGTQVQADGAEVEARRTRPNSPLGPFLLLMILMLGFAVISVALPDSDPVAATEPESPLEEPTDLLDAERGIGEVVAGFHDALVAVAAGPEDSFVHVLWPNARPLVTRETSAGSDFAFDTSGVFIATTSAVVGETGASLLAGRFNSLRPIAQGATSFAWHDGTPGRLGYVLDRGERWELWSVTPGFVDGVEIVGVAPTPQLAAWGDWGFALQDGDQVRLLTPDGDRKASYRGEVLASRRDGWLLVAGESVDLLSAGGGVVRLQIDPERVGPISSASFSPDGQSIAVVGTRGILIAPIRGDGGTTESAAEDGSQAVWSGDSRFLIVPRGEGLSIFDLQTVNQYSLLENREFRSVGIIAIGNS